MGEGFKDVLGRRSTFWKSNIWVGLGERCNNFEKMWMNYEVYFRAKVCSISSSLPTHVEKWRHRYLVNNFNGIITVSNNELGM